MEPRQSSENRASDYVPRGNGVQESVQLSSIVIADHDLSGPFLSVMHNHLRPKGLPHAALDVLNPGGFFRLLTSRDNDG